MQWKCIWGRRRARRGEGAYEGEEEEHEVRGEEDEKKEKEGI